MSIQSSKEIKRWELEYYITPGIKKDSKDKSYGLIILNQPINPVTEAFKIIWKDAKIRVCADGGANRLFEAFEMIPDLNDLEKEELRASDFKSYLPEYIYGDLDSLLPNVKNYYASKGVKVDKESDQNSTDLMKCYKLIQRVSSEYSLDKHFDLIIHGGIGGRFDHSLASIQALYIFPKQITVIIYSIDNISFLLWPEYKHFIKISNKVIGPNCGLLPIGGIVEKLYTKGLKWNLDGQSSSFGGLVSTSNLINSELIEIEMDSDNPIVFTIEIL